MFRESAMLISDLQKRLRSRVRQRIASGEMTGAELARRAGFQQAHISNFLNSRRGMSVATMDRVMRVMHLRVRDLMPEASVKRIEAAADGAGLFVQIPVVAQRLLLKPNYEPGEALELFCFKRSLLRRIRQGMDRDRRHWQRFVLLKADRDVAAAMRPRLMRGAVLLVDRHYNSLRSYRRNEPNLYVIKSGAEFKVCYAELQGDQLTLRPENPESALGYIRLRKGESCSDYIVGRVAHIAMEA
jgi:transcriptional regulator with XRE-family HTH domain